MKKCTDCGGPIVSRKENVRYEDCGLDNVYLIGITVRECFTCKGKELVIPLIDELHRVIARSVAKGAGRLSGAEIRFLRKYLGYSSGEAAAALDVDPATMSRWENGKREMPVASERLLRFMVFNQSPADWYPTEDLMELTGTRKKETKEVRLRAGSTGWHQTIMATDPSRPERRAQ